MQFDGNYADSRLRFDFRSAKGSSHPSPRPQQENPQDTQDADRISVSLFRGTRRIVIPATRLYTIYFNRTEGYFRIEGDGWAAVRSSCPRF